MANAGSTIKYDDNFDVTNRTVTWRRGFFEIGPNKKQIPFLVKTKKYTIQGYGTNLIKAYRRPYFEQR